LIDDHVLDKKPYKQHTGDKHDELEACWILSMFGFDPADLTGEFALVISFS